MPFFFLLIIIYIILVHKVNTMNKIVCLECQNDIGLEDREYVVGEIIECPFCGTELEVVEVLEDGTVMVEVIEEEK